MPSFGHLDIGSVPGNSDELNLPDLRGFAVESVRLPTEESSCSIYSSTTWSAEACALSISNIGVSILSVGCKWSLGGNESCGWDAWGNVGCCKWSLGGNKTYGWDAWGNVGWVVAVSLTWTGFEEASITHTLCVSASWPSEMSDNMASNVLCCSCVDELEACAISRGLLAVLC